MKNDLQNIKTAAVPMSGTINQQAEKIYNINEASSVTTGDINTTNIFIGSGRTPEQIPTGQLGQSHEYYNLFVMGGQEFPAYDRGYFMVSKDRALTEYMSPDIKDEFASLSPKAIEKIKTFPAIFCSENKDYGKAGDGQIAQFGYVTGITVQDNGIRIHFITIRPLYQSSLNEILYELSIMGNNQFNEFNRTHWCIKRNNLYETLQDANLM